MSKTTKIKIYLTSPPDAGIHSITNRFCNDVFHDKNPQAFPVTNQGKLVKYKKQKIGLELHNAKA